MTKYLLLLLAFSSLAHAQEDLEDDLAIDPFQEELTLSSDVYTPKEQEKLDEKANDELYTEPPLSTGTPVLTAEDDTPTKETPAEEELFDKPSPETTTPVLTTLEADQPRGGKEFNPRKSHLVTTFALEGIKYEFEQDFQGERKNFKDTERELYGARLGVGYEMYLGAGFNTTTKLNGFYTGTLFEQKQTANPDVEDVDFAFSKRTSSFWGGELAQSIGFLFDMKSKNLFGDIVQLTIEPFLEAGIGRAFAYNRINYHYDTTGTVNSDGVIEDYRRTMSDTLTTTRLSAGFNVISSQGYFLHVMASLVNFDLSKREVEEKKRQNGGVFVETDPQFSEDLDPVLSYTIGGGYKF